MASTPNETASDQPSPPPSLQELTRRSARAILLPYIVNYASSAAPSDRPREIAIIVNPRTGSLTLIEGSTDVEAFLLGKEGRVPASKASIAAMPVVKVEEEGLDCAICLSEFEVGEEAKQMPCKHRYHGDCIDKWLGIQGSCPACRYRMPAEEEEKNDKGSGGDGEEPEEAAAEEEEEEEENQGDGEGHGGEIRRIPTFVFHIYFAPRRRSRNSSNSGSESGELGDPVYNNSGSVGDDQQSSAEDMDIDSGSEEMDVDRNLL